MEFSQNIQSINSSKSASQRIMLEYVVNPNLREDIAKSAVTDIKGFEIRLNANVSYLYVQAILEEFHDVQDSSQFIMNNDILDLQHIMGPNILYDKNETYMSIQTLQDKNEYTTTDIITKYNTLTSLSEQSKNTKLTALLKQLQEEKQAVLQISRFYSALLKMLQNAAKEIDQVEEHYNTTKVNP